MYTKLSDCVWENKALNWISNPPNNRKFNYEKRIYVNPRDKILVECTEFELMKNFGICRQSVQDLKSTLPGKARSAKGFYLLSVAEQLGLVK